jgi:peptidoglycan/xylan/chitin deacetylase (PgdA/CDA1 family)
MVSTETFRRQLLYVKSRYKLMTLDELAEAIDSGAGLEQPSCVITFDDGWRDNYEHAFPVLKELGAPATIFVVPDHVESGEDFWPDRLTRILLGWNREDSGSHRLLREAIGDACDLHGTESRRKRLDLADAAIASLKSLPLEEIHAILTRLEESGLVNGCHSPDSRSICSWSDLQEMTATQLVTIGSHTNSHVILTVELRERCEGEIVKSKRTIENKLDAPVRHFAYPNGNFNGQLADLVRKAGYRSACTCLSGTNTHATSPYEIRRIHVLDVERVYRKRFPAFRFALQLSPEWHVVMRMRNSLGSFR